MSGQTKTVLAGKRGSPVAQVGGVDAPSAALRPAGRRIARAMPSDGGQTPVYERVLAHLQRAIEDGEYHPGDKLPSERALMTSLGASRTPIREALFTLRSRGLVRARPGARAEVVRAGTHDMLSQLSSAARQLLDAPGGMSHFQEARSLFECAIARHAARHATPKQIELLELALAENRRAVSRADEFAATDVAFHLALAEIPNNPIFTALHDALGRWLMDQRLTGLRVRGSQRSVMRDHERIFEAVRRHDPDGAEVAMAEHLANVARYFWKARSGATPP
jgi:GntR family transcriptional regulator, sialic acid-inducible nan operon repressor